MKFSKKSALRGGLYHIALIFLVTSSFNWGFGKLTGIDIIRRIFADTQLPETSIALVLCVSSVIVLWNNWVD